MFQTINHAQIIWNRKSKMSGLMGGHVNIRSLLPKLPQIEILLSGSNLDFLGISETWLNDSVSTELLNIEGYNIFRNDRQQNKKGGGTLLYIKNTLASTALDLTMTLECVGVEVRLSQQMSFNVINIYRPPDAGQEFYQHFDELLKSVANKESIILGDFNVDWNSKPKKKKLKTILDKRGYKQLMDRPTRITDNSQTTIDLIITNQPQRIKKYYSLTTGMCLADHNLIIIYRKLHRRIVRRPQKSSYIPKAALGSLDNDIAGTNWDSLFSLCNADAIAAGFISTISYIAQAHTKTRVITHKSRGYPWISDPLRKLMKKRDKALKQYLITKSRADQLIFKQLRNQTVRLLRSSKANYFLHQSKLAKGNPKQLWRIIDDLTGRNTNKDKITLSIDGRLATEGTEVAGLFSDYFASIVNEPNINSAGQAGGGVGAELSVPSSTKDGWTIGPVSVVQTANIIKKLNPSKTKDYYGLQTTLLQRNNLYLARPLCMLVNQSIVESVFPDTLKLAYITPIFKAGCKMDIKNYRPVSILPVISKVIEKAVTQQLTEYIERSQLLNPSQYGFRRGYSTESACVHLTELLRCKIDRGGVVGAVFLDLKKAFDMICHQRLLNKLTNFNFSAKSIKWIQSYLANRTQCVRINNTYSDFEPYPKGVPQGSVISPILFSLYINDLPKVCPKVHTQMYADDTAIFYHGKTPEEVAVVLSDAMTSIENWLKNNHLSLNVKKTVAIFFAKKDIPHPPPITVAGVPLNIVQSVKYLGVIFDSTLKFKTHIQKLTKTVNMTLRTFGHIRNSLSTEAATAFYHAMIISRFNYCITCWSQAPSTTLTQIESLYKRAAKILDKKDRSFHHCHAYKNRGLLNMGNLIKHANLVLIHKILYEEASPTLRDYIQLTASTAVRDTRASANMNCRAPLRTSSFGQAALSVRGIKMWNELPYDLKETPSSKRFSQQLRQFLLDNQICQCS